MAALRNDRSRPDDACGSLGTSHASAFGCRANASLIHAKLRNVLLPIGLRDALDRSRPLTKTIFQSFGVSGPSSRIESRSPVRRGDHRKTRTLVWLGHGSDFSRPV